MSSDLLARAACRTRTYLPLNVDDVPPMVACVFGLSSIDDRSALPVWTERQRIHPAQSVRVEREDVSSIEVVIAGVPHTYNLRDPGPLWSDVDVSHGVYIDLTALSHHVWAPLIKSALEHVRAPVFALYAEPLDYSVHGSPASPSVFNLSERCRGLAPLPGFARLAGPDDESMALFVAFIGFEGARARYLASTLDPLPRTIAVVGVPGFKADFPAQAISCNREFLHETRAFEQIRLAAAHCPFEAKAALESIRADHPKASYIYVAPIGTKPHALGAVLFAIEHPAGVELMYDHPLRRSGRTTGVGPMHIFMLSA